MVRFVFKGDTFVHQTPICLDTLSLPSLLTHVPLSLEKPVPSPRELFTDMFDSDVSPFIRQLLQRRIRTKTQISKMWDAQPVGLRRVYEARVALLETEWTRLRAEHDAAQRSQLASDDDEAARRRSESKAKRKQLSQRRKERIAQQIANGLFDEIEAKAQPVKKVKNVKKVKKAKKSKQKKAKVSKLGKKRKLKKWKDKKQQRPVEEWPAPPLLSPKKKTDVKVRRKVVESVLRFRVQMGSEWLEHWMDAAQMEAVRSKVCAAQFVGKLRRIRVWVYMDVCCRFGGQCIELLTNGDGVAMESRGGKDGKAVMLFELRWAVFGDCLKDRLDSAKMAVAFVKNTQALRIDIPVHVLSE